MTKHVAYSSVALFVVLLVSARAHDYRPECMDVVDNFSWCAAYLEGVYDDPSPHCCDGLQVLNAIAKGQKGGARRICGCIEDMATETVHPPFMPSRINLLYLDCDIHLGFPISERMDCSMVD
ncbi:hypothetical protein RJ640_014511 [Escallonia rubra]|uniref:Bifunctional inhibitor/plant lipid transfer protein/seed storage helical domain-containing protein n=1 Tax=Escallonia rubra TaxID=112253 RepID=A0AA88UPB3_9ASTE|nr:hypothetical protein RJ640_014511 [Escallonia rubra]